jgi:hypothetical protein
MIQQFTAMLNARFALNNTPMPGAKQTSKTSKPVRETVVYPKIKVDDANNPCLDPSISFEHVLQCGHLVTTALPNQPCAPNCHHVAEDANLDRSLKHKKAMKMLNGKKVSDKDFYCDACVEMEIETKIPANFSSSHAEQRRTTLRPREAKMRKKDTMFRKCYIALKVTSVQCRSDGTLSSRYAPVEPGHPFDRSIPRSGENMFEDVDPDPMEEGKKVVATVKRKASQALIEDDSNIENDDRGVENTRTSRQTSRQIPPASKDDGDVDDDRAAKAVDNANRRQTIARRSLSPRAPSKRPRQQLKNLYSKKSS